MKEYLLMFAALLLITACSNDDSISKKENSDTDKVVANEEIEKNTEEGRLTEVGQKIKDPQTRSTVELLAIKEVNETIDLDPIKLTIDDIKIIRMSDIKNQDLLYSISEFTDKKEFDYIQIQYEIENTEDKNIRLNSPIVAVVLNTGEQIDSFEKDFSRDPNFAKTLYGKVKNESMVSLIIEETNPENIEEIKIVTGRVDDDDTMSTLVDEQAVTYEIE